MSDVRLITNCGKIPILFTYEFYETMEEVRQKIQLDEGRKVQQVSYSTFHNCLTQVNFSDKIIRSNIRI